MTAASSDVMARSKSEAKRLEVQRAAAAEKKASGTRVPATTMVTPGRLNAAPYNPRTIEPEMLEGLKQDIRHFGFVVNVVVQKHSPKYGDNVIVGGHQRLRALREISIEDNTPLPDVPAVFLDLTDREAKKLNRALNAERGEDDPKLLAEMLEDIHHESPITPEEASVMGLQEEDLSRYLKMNDPPVVTGPDEGKSFGRSVTFSLVFNDVRERDAVKTKLDELAEAGNKKTGEVVLGLLGKRKA